METNLASLFIITVAGLAFTIWILVQLYKHDNPKKKEKDFDYWS